MNPLMNYLHASPPHSCLRGNPEKRLPEWVCKALATWVNLRTGVPEWRSGSASFWPDSEWVSEHSWEGVKEKGKEGREVRFEEGVGEYTVTHTHTHILLLSTVVGTIGRSLWWPDTGHDPISKHAISHSHRDAFLTSATANCLEQNNVMFLTFDMWTRMSLTTTIYTGKSVYIVTLIPLLLRSSHHLTASFCFSKVYYKLKWWQHDQSYS